MKKLRRGIVGLNIQYPISRLILDGSKTIETRTYAIPTGFIGKELAIIETPGRTGGFKARIIGTIIFGESFKYKSKAAFYRDIAKHKVTPDSPWKWTTKPKHGWPIISVSRFKKPIPAPDKKGIRYTSCIEI